MIRKPYVAGKFYPSSSVQLESFIQEALAKAGKNKRENIKGILAPHAGYVYSGNAAAKSYTFLENSHFSKFIIIGTCHSKRIEKAALPSFKFFSTPLGNVEVDLALVEKLLSNKFFTQDDEAHINEHSIEVQIPFLQSIKKEKFKIIPILLNSMDPLILKGAGWAIGKILKDEDCAIIVSSDLSHYPDADTAALSDEALLESYRLALCQGQEEYFDLAFSLLQERFPEVDTPACGFSSMSCAISALLAAGFSGFEKILYTNSGEISGDKSAVVGYGSGVFLRDYKKCKLELSPKEKKDLLLMARTSVEKSLGLKNDVCEGKSFKFLTPASLFVTLTYKGRLRGCIGCLSPNYLLDEAVIKYARSAAFGDNRFSEVSAEEIKNIKFEISLLSPLKRISSYEEIKTGIHGVMIKSGHRSGTYLPQVWEHFSTKEDFLSSLCVEKAGLPKDFWKQKSAELYIYSADHFEES